MFKERLAKLIDVKSIITVMVVGVLCYLAVKGTVSGEAFLGVASTVMSFYFGTQHAKKGVTKDEQ